MKLRTRTSLTLLLLLTSLVAALGVAGRTALVGQALSIERDATSREAQRVREALGREIDVLLAKAGDWAVWDDTYRFIQDGNDAYLESNISNSAFEEMHLNAIAFFDARSALWRGFGWSEGGEELTPIPPALLSALLAQPALLQQSDESPGRAGLLQTGDDGIWLIAARPILTSERTGPSRGTLLFARRFDDQVVQSIGRLTGVRLDMRLVDSGVAAPTSLDPRVVTRSRNEINASWVEPDVLAAPLLLVTLSVSRPIYQQALASFWYFLLSLAFLGLVCGFSLHALLGRFVIHRLEDLQRGVRRIAAAGDAEGQVCDAGRDELAELGRDINGMLRALADAQRELHAQQDALFSANAALAAARAAADSANQAKSTFLANMSHEIRTPMTAIIGFAETLREPDLNEELRQSALESIQRNGAHLLQIINDILDLSKIEAGGVEVEQIACAPWDLLCDAVAALRPRADAAGVELALAADGPVPETICTDPTRLKQIVLNLVGNALKFTPRGSVQIRAALVTQAAAPRLAVSVRDSGIGMTAEQLTRLFRPFSQADASTTRRFGGTGLGLTISKRLVEMLGGEIEVESRPGVGTEFRFTIATGSLQGVRLMQPAASAATNRQPTSAARVAATPADLRGRVLLAEDGPDNQKLISHVLRKAGLECEIVGDGKAALESALGAWRGGRPFDVVLMDMQMPILDGYEASRRLRDAGYDAPIIALTAHAMSTDRDKCLAAGCDDYLTKPIDRAALLELIAQCLAASTSR